VYQHKLYLSVALCIIKSVTSLKGKMVYKPGTQEKVDFATLCVSGGVVNAYKALQLAAKVASNKN
jgi:cell wall-associated protease